MCERYLEMLRDTVTVTVAYNITVDSGVFSVEDGVSRTTIHKYLITFIFQMLLS